ncbi:hypothetical protein N7535_004035 [Penicillium sp. DV-2018c]|nr:hypothetical protein N7535_004035 [Penicillium sp. DV-2018c]
MCLDFVLEKWGLTRLGTSPGLLMALQYLLRNAVGVGTLAQSLAAYDPQFSVSGHKVLRLSETWQNLLSYVLEVLSVDPTVLLGQYILQRGLYMARNRRHNGFEAQGVQPNSNANAERDNHANAFEAQGEQSWFDTEEDVDSPYTTEEQVEDPWPAAAFPPNRPLPPIPRPSSYRSLDTLESTTSTERPLSPFPEETVDFNDVTF